MRPKSSRGCYSQRTRRPPAPYDWSTRADIVAQGTWSIPGDDQWDEFSWTVSDANFASEWGWNFRFDAISSPNEFLIKKVRVIKSNRPVN